MKTIIQTLLDHSTNPITREEERKLLYKAKRNNLDARETLLRCFIRYAIKYSKRYTEKGMEEEDYAQLSMIGILDAIKHFNLRKKVRFMTYLNYRLKSVLVKAQMEGELIRIPKGNEYKSKEPKEMIALTDFEIEEKRKKPLDKDSLWFMECLSVREQLILRCRFFYGMTYGQVGKVVKISKERVRQVLKEIFERIRNESKTELRRSTQRLRNSSKKPRADTIFGFGKQMVKRFKNRRNKCR